MCMVSSVVRGHAQREQRRGPGHEALGVSALRPGLGPRLWLGSELGPPRLHAQLVKNNRRSPHPDCLKSNVCQSNSPNSWVRRLSMFQRYVQRTDLPDDVPPMSCARTRPRMHTPHRERQGRGPAHCTARALHIAPHALGPFHHRCSCVCARAWQAGHAGGRATAAFALQHDAPHSSCG